MHKHLKYISFALLFLFSCENDFQVTGDWEEIMVINSILDPGQPEQYVKVTKAFLNKGRDAYEIAKANHDSLYYADELDVSISQLNSTGSIVKTYKLARTLLTGKDPGIFSDSGNYIYKATTPGFSDDYKYQVSVTNTKTGKTATAITSLVQGLCIRVPAHGAYSTLEHCTDYGIYDSIPFHRKYEIKYYTAKNAALYEILIDFTYYNYFESDFVDSNKVRWQIMNPTHKDYVITNVQSFFIPKDSFFVFLRSAIPFEKDLDGTQRKAGPVDLTINVASSDFETYQKLLTTSKTLTQSSPEFTNVKGGLGLVASRNHRTVHIKRMEWTSLDTLILNYPELKFIK